jgi:hypothetical protein
VVFEFVCSSGIGLAGVGNKLGGKKLVTIVSACANCKMT